MQPVPVVQVLEVPVEARPHETGVEGGEAGQHAREEFLQGEGRGRGEGVEGCGGGCVGGVEADADNAQIFRGGVVRVYEDATDLDEGFPRGVGRVGGDCGM